MICQFVSEGRIQKEVTDGEKIELGPRACRISFSFGSAELEKDDDFLEYLLMFLTVSRGTASYNA